MSPFPINLSQLNVAPPVAHMSCERGWKGGRDRTDGPKWWKQKPADEESERSHDKMASTAMPPLFDRYRSFAIILEGGPPPTPTLIPRKRKSRRIANVEHPSSTPAPYSVVLFFLIPVVLVKWIR
ncbi:hypothetical protein CDAR_512251 [Caerostris darwini]|uniref:Uncharacterized protein n=1 Tax=Caerostris darwini TaxID=1538125 RepID=A0AAV4WGK1_9ARAC|nr:hypothetical protein CDAR_512251 [Caerostris darwini]